MTTPKLTVQSHYDDDGGQVERLTAALRRLGFQPGQVQVSELAALDHFHTGGLKATRDLAALAGIQPGSQILDVGSGLGGPARLLAEEYGCKVSGVDLTPVYCDLAAMLSRWCNMEASTTFQVGSALELPFEDQSFDMTWTFQVQMNIEDKARFYGEMFRVLKPGGKLAFQDIYQGDGRALDFPLPWAGDSSISFLIAPEQCCNLLEETGFKKIVWRNKRELPPSKPESAPLPPVSAAAPDSGPGLHLILGEEFLRAKRLNAQQAFKDGRIEFFQGVFQKPA